MKRKIIITFLCLTMGLSIVACGNKASTTPSTEKATATESNTEVVAEVATESTNTETSDYIDPSTIANNNSDESSDSSDSSDSSENSNVNQEEVEIENSKWADINGKWDAVHQWSLYAQSQGADGAAGWCWTYDHGKAAGDQPSYAVYMKEGSPDYGKVFHVGDYLPDGTQLCGTMEEYAAFIDKDMARVAEEAGADVYTDENTGKTVIKID